MESGEWRISRERKGKKGNIEVLGMREKSRKGREGEPNTVLGGSFSFLKSGLRGSSHGRRAWKILVQINHIHCTITSCKPDKPDKLSWAPLARHQLSVSVLRQVTKFTPSSAHYAHR